MATYLYKLLIRLDQDRVIQYLTADVLATNKGMMKVFEKGDLPIDARLENGLYRLTVPFDETST